MASESIAHLAFGLMGYCLRAHCARGIIVKYCSVSRRVTETHGQTCNYPVITPSLYLCNYVFRV